MKIELQNNVIMYISDLVFMVFRVIYVLSSALFKFIFLLLSRIVLGILVDK